MRDRNYVLASGSPRRIEMFRAHGIEPMVVPAHIEENMPAIGGMTETVMFLALKKAKYVEKSCSGSLPENSVIIAADTVVYKDKIMGKPVDKADGFCMLSALKNTYHYVVTGVALLAADKPNARVFAEITKVYFKDYTDEELLDYLDTDEAYDKAGGYAIQGYFAKYTEKIEGDYNTVVGFPWDRIQRELALL